MDYSVVSNCMNLGQKGVCKWVRYRTALSMTHRECGYWPISVKPEHGCGPRAAISLIKNKEVTTDCGNHEM